MMTESGPSPSAPRAGRFDSQRLQLLLVGERRRLLGYIRRHFPECLSPTVEPEDVLNDTFFEAVRRMNSFVPRDDASIFRLLVTIARRRMAQLLRVQGRAKHGGKSKRVAQSASIVGKLAELAVHHRTPSRSASRHEFMDHLAGALNDLAEDLRTAVTLRCIDGLSPAEVGVRMGRTERAVHQLCYRGIQHLRRKLRSASMFT
jgi:RNA polymerase sigma-70 factor (ECF subfamily)